MERSRKIFRKIVSAANQVITIANDHADSQDSNKVSRFHFQLEDDMRRIAVTCDCLAGMLEKPRSERGPAVDVRIRDWMGTDEPQECLDTLSQMARLLRQDRPSVSRVPLIPSRTTGRLRGPTGMQDKIKQAVDLLHCKGCFHFLFSTEVWDSEETVEKQYGVSRSRDGVVTQPEVVTAVELPVTAVVETAHDQDRHATSQRSRELKSDKQKEAEEKKLEEILKWLDGLNCAEKQDATLLLRQEDTCKWLFNTSQYRMWRDTGSGSLWLRGKPGAGKSVLVSFVIDSLKKTRREGDIFAFFYCDFRNERSTSSAEVLRSILCQLLRQLRDRSANLGTLLETLMEAKEWGGGTLGNAKELAGFVSRVAELFTRKPVVIVDALDECKDVRKLIQALMETGDHVRLFVASRPLRVIMDELLSLPFVSMEDMADELSMDIAVHVTREMDVRRRLRDLDAVLKTEIHAVLCDKADGMFRWVQCSIDALDRCVTRKEVRDALYNLPTGLDETYERIILAIDMEAPAGRLAQRALNWLVVALRPLQLSEIMEALSINLERRILDFDIGPVHSGALLDACGSLVTYTEKTGVVILSHFSVKEYLMSKCMRTNLESYHVNLEHAHLLLLRSCMCYMSICLKQARGPPLTDISHSGNTRTSSQHLVQLHPKLHPLLDYALDDALGYFEHLGSMFESAIPDVVILARDIQRHSWVWDNVCIPARRLGWEIKSVKPHWPAAVHDLLLYILVAFASNSLMSAYFRRTAFKPKDGTNPLVYAAYFDKEQHARTLSSLGARINSRGWEIDGYRQSLPIEVAFYRQHYSMVTYLVEEGCNLPSHIFTYSFNLGVPVILFDRVPAFIARLLIQSDDFPENTNDYSSESAVYVTETLNNLITQSSITEQDLIVFTRRFVQIADEHSTMKLIKLAFLRFAVTEGYLSAARYLLTISTLLPPSFLIQLYPYSGRWKTAPIIRLLVDNGADMLARTWSRDSVLHTVLWAAGSSESRYLVNNDSDESDILEVAKLLVERGCDPFEADCHGKAPLQLAVEQGYISVARYLLHLGAHPSPDFLVTLEHGWLHRTRRMAAAIQLLVENGANALVRTSDGDSLLHVILRSLDDDDDKEAFETTSVLVRYGCNPLEADARGKAPLQIAIEQGCISVVQYLLTLGAHLPPDFPVTSELDWPWRRITPMIRLLLESGINTLTSDGDSLLHVILGPRIRNVSEDHDNDDLEAARTLVGYGCDPLEADSRGKTPLHLAVEEQHISVARYLLTLGANPSPHFFLTLKDDWWRWSMAPMIRLLVENGANPLVYTSDGDSLLHIVLRSSDSDEKALEATRLLVGYGCNPLEVDSHGKTPLQIAVAQDHVLTARYLLTRGAHPPSDFFVTLENDQQYQNIGSMVRLLVENGANALVYTSGNGDPLLHVMLRVLDNGNDALEVAKLLVGYGCDPLEATPHGKTALHIAVEQSHTSVVRYLITLGVRPPANFFVTLDDNWCRWKRIAPIICLLVENGANVLVHTSDGDSLLHTMLHSIHGDDENALEVVRFLVEHGCDPLEADSHGNTPLQISVEHGYVSVARYLLALGAPLPSDSTSTVGSYRWYQSRSSMLRLLVECGTNILAHTDNGDSLLHIVLQSSMNDESALEEARVLVGYGCDIHEANVHGETPLHIAVERQYISVARYLLTLGARPPPDFFVKLGRHGRYKRKAPVIRLLVENGASALARTVEGDSLLHVVLQTSEDDTNTLEVAKVLVGYGCDPLEADSCGNTPLQIAAERGYTAVAQYLLSLGTQPLPDLLVISQCSWWDRSIGPMIRLLVENGANILRHTSDGDSLLHVMLRSSDNGDNALQAARVLVKYGCDPLGTNSRGETPLYIAAGRSYLSVTRYLIARGASVLTKTHGGDTVLHAAASGIRYSSYMHRDDYAIEVVKCLVKHGCDPAASNNNGKTPLHHAVNLGYIKTMKYLLSLNIPSPRDILFTAILSDHNTDCCLHIIETLVASGCDTQTRNSDGDTVLQAAIKKEKNDVAEYLLSVLSLDNVPFEDSLSAAVRAPSSVQSKMRCTATDHRSRSASLEPPAAKRAKRS